MVEAISSHGCSAALMLASQVAVAALQLRTIVVSCRRGAARGAGSTGTSQVYREVATQSDASNRQLNLTLRLGQRKHRVVGRSGRQELQDCHKQSRDGMQPKDRYTYFLDRFPESDEKLAILWRSLVQQYSGLLLAVGSGKLPAVAGFAEEIPSCSGR